MSAVVTLPPDIAVLMYHYVRPADPPIRVGAGAVDLDTFAAQLDDLQRHAAVVSWLPLYHDMGLIAGFLLPTWLGVPIIAMDPFEWIARRPARPTSTMASDPARRLMSSRLRCALAIDATIGATFFW